MTDYREELNMPQGSPPPDERKLNGAAPAQGINGGEFEFPKPRADRLISRSNIAMLDTAKFEQMQRAAVMMAQGTLTPEDLRGYYDNNTFRMHPAHTVVANCFQIINLAERWGFDPYQLMACVYVHDNRLGFEGKVIHAAIEQCLDIRLNYEFGNSASGEEMYVTVYGKFDDEEEPREIKGSVRQWHKGPNSPWKDPGAWELLLRYRGAREWCRTHAPSVVLGIYSKDELDAIKDEGWTKVEAVAAPEPKPGPPKTAPPRRAAVGERLQAFADGKDVVGVAPEPATPPPQRIAVEGKGKPKKITAAEVPDKYEREWLEAFEADLGECRNKMAIDIMLDRRENALAVLSEPGKIKSDAITNAALQRVR